MKGQQVENQFVMSKIVVVKQLQMRDSFEPGVQKLPLICECWNNQSISDIKNCCCQTTD